jgi:uncharacterized protein YjiS (DUF1127 family)
MTRVDEIDPATATIVLDDFVALGAPKERPATHALVPWVAEALKICRYAGSWLVNPFIRTYRRWRRYRRTYNELTRLTDRELDDVGIHRMEIRTIAREWASTYEMMGEEY